MPRTPSVGSTPARFRGDWDVLEISDRRDSGGATTVLGEELAVTRMSLGHPLHHPNDQGVLEPLDLVGALSQGQRRGQPSSLLAHDARSRWRTEEYATSRGTLFRNVLPSGAVTDPGGWPLTLAPLAGRGQSD